MKPNLHALPHNGCRGWFMVQLMSPPLLQFSPLPSIFNWNLLWAVKWSMVGAVSRGAVCVPAMSGKVEVAPGWVGRETVGDVGPLFHAV